MVRTFFLLRFIAVKHFWGRSSEGMTYDPICPDNKMKYYVRTFLIISAVYWSTRPTTVSAGSDHYFHTCCPSVRPGRHKTSKSSDNHCRPGLWAGQVDHSWLLSCINLYSSKCFQLGNININERLKNCPKYIVLKNFEWSEVLSIFLLQLHMWEYVMFCSSAYKSYVQTKRFYYITNKKSNIIS